MQQNFKSYPQVVSQFHHIAYKVKEGIITTNFIFDKKKDLKDIASDVFK